MMFNERIKQMYEDRRMPQRKLEYSKIERGEQIALAGNLSHFAGKQILLPCREGLCARLMEKSGLILICQKLPSNDNIFVNLKLNYYGKRYK
jgi:hypothetical protein